MLSGILIRAPSRVVFVPGCGCVFDPLVGGFIATQTGVIWVKVEHGVGVRVREGCPLGELCNIKELSLLLQTSA